MSSEIKKLSQETTLSDSDLREYEFETKSPEDTRGWVKSKLDNDPFTRVIQVYDIPHAKYSRADMVWCCNCQKRNHHIGGVTEHESGARRTIGWYCCAVQLDVQIDTSRQALLALGARQTCLKQADDLVSLLPELLESIQEDLKGATCLGAFTHTRNQLQQNLHPLVKDLQTLAVGKGGVATWEEEFVDYSGTALTRESGENGSELRGQKKIRRLREHKIVGLELIDPRTDLVPTIDRAIEKIQELASFYTQVSYLGTDGIHTKVFHSNINKLTRVIKELLSVEAVLYSLLHFFQPANLAFVAAYRNSRMADGSRPYFAEGNMIGHLLEDKRLVVVKPVDYHVPRLRHLARIETLLARKIRRPHDR